MLENNKLEIIFYILTHTNNPLINLNLNKINPLN